MKIIIAGAGAVGTHLAKLLSDEKQDIILMDENEEKLSKLDSNFDLMTVNASPTSISGLKNAGVAGADLFIGVMPEESRNMTACMLATNMGAKKTVARIDNYEYLLPKHKEFFSQLGVHSLIYPEMLAAKDIVDAIKMSWKKSSPISPVCSGTDPVNGSFKPISRITCKVPSCPTATPTANLPVSL